MIHYLVCKFSEIKVTPEDVTLTQNKDKEWDYLFPDSSYKNNFTTNKLPICVNYHNLPLIKNQNLNLQVKFRHWYW